MPTEPATEPATAFTDRKDGKARPRPRPHLLPSGPQHQNDYKIHGGTRDAQRDDDHDGRDDPKRQSSIGSGSSGTKPIVSYAGSSCGFADGSRSQARFNAPFGLAMSPDRTAIFVADDKNHRIRKIALAFGTVSTVVGTSDEKQRESGRQPSRPAFNVLCRPHGLSVDREGRLLIADTDHHRLIQASPDGSGSYHATLLAGSEEGCADGKTTEAQFRYPYSVIPGERQGVVYAADTDNHRIVKIEDGQVVTIAGSDKRDQGECGYKDGPGFQARFTKPTHLALSPDGSALIVTDHGNQCVRRVNEIQREAKVWVETLAGGPGEPGFADGEAKTAKFNNLYSTCFRGEGELLIADLANHRIRSLDLKRGLVTTLLSADHHSLINCPVAVLPGSDTDDHHFYIVSRGNDRVLSWNRPLPNYV